MAMIEYLVSFVQCLCLLGYLYGAWLVITHKAQAGTMHGRTAVPPPSRDDDLASHRYIACG
jgi:hypothetical protein